jgi:polysaccharide biosynthesis/export protein
VLAILSRVLPFFMVAILVVPAAAFAQDASYCSPQGLNAAGQSCTPIPQVGSAAGQTAAPAQTPLAPGQQQTGIPTITNRPSSAIPQVQFPSNEQQQQQQLQQNPPFGQRPTAFPERNEFQDFVAESVGKIVPMFGYNLFQGGPSTFAPVDRVPVTADYVIGPGDEILVRAWGQVDIDYRAIVDRDGAISIPKVGNVNVAGIRFQEIHGYLKTAIGRVYRNFELNVAMGQLRSIQIFVVGHAARPGSYTVSSLSSLVNAIFASGGPTTKGSMRTIQLKRGGKLVTEFDMYDLLLKGDKSKDAPLQPGDVIYIPPIGQLAAISGSVNNAAIYEIMSNTSLSDLVALAGGLAATADGQKVTIERIVDRKVRKIEEFKFDKEGLAHGLRDGDVVQVLPISPRFDNAVTVKGNVAVPARHPWHSGMTVKDVVPDRAALIVPDYWVKRNLLTRADKAIALAKERQELATTPRADLLTASKQEGAGPALGQERVRTEIKRTLPEVNWDYAVVERLNRNDLTTQLIPFNLGKAILEGDPQQNLLLQPGDVITIFSKDDIQVPVAKQTRFVKLEGEVGNPGVYQVLPGETLRQLIARVGGFTPSAYLFGSTFTRESTRQLQQKRLTEFIDRLEQEVNRNMSQTAISSEEVANRQAASQGQLSLITRLRKVQATGRIVLEMPGDAGGVAQLPDLALEDGDTFIVPSRPSTVAVVGTVYNENAFIYRGDKKVADYLAQAGGPTKDADSSSVYIIRADGTVISKRQSGGWLTTSFDGGRLMPGDTVVVPENLEKFRFTKELKDWSQVFYQFALGVAGLKVLKGL